LLHAPRAAGARNICVGFADVTRASGVNPAHLSRKCYAQNSRTMCVKLYVALVMQMLRATRDVTFGPLCMKCPLIGRYQAS
jgi:hypothetical protein